MVTTNLALLITALITVESGGDDFAIGDDGRAFGCLQIHACVVEDVNRLFSLVFDHDHMFDRTSSRLVCELYLRHYGSEKRLGRTPTAHDLARIWNGGPNGYMKDSTIAYADRVTALFQQLLNLEEGGDIRGTFACRRINP